MLLQEEKTPDLRVRRTRMLIQKAFGELLEEKSFQSITIQDIAERAMVNRATFYDHFADKYALFDYTMREWFRQTLQSKLPDDFKFCISNLQFLIEVVCDFLVQIEDHCTVKNQQVLPPFDEQITSLISEILVEWFHSPAYSGDTRSAALAADVASWAIYGAAFHWSKQIARPESSIEFALQATPMISAILRPFEISR